LTTTETASATANATVFAFSGHVTLYAAAAVAVLILLTWLLSVAVHDASVIDVIWGPAFVVVAVVSALAGHGADSRRWLLVGLTAAWGLRLGFHIARRKLSETGEDKRYAAMRAAHPDNFALWSLRSVFLLQGVLVLIVGLPQQVAADRPAPLGLTIIPGLVVWAVGLTFEAVGDAQLTRFKADPANRGQVMDHGLWRYTRHPNYFGDLCVWVGLWLVAVPAGGTWWTVISPAIMAVLLVRVSGAGLLEKDIEQRRPGYTDYIKRTSGFIPLPPRGAKR
jgi:steroid 5-alpha reductase family enzyme